MATNFDNLSEINIKIKNKVAPTDKEKEILQYKLNKQLNEEEHLYIFTEILQGLEKKIYTITENCTLFDLNDLSPDNFWKIFYYAQLFIQNHERQKELEVAGRDNVSKSDELNEKMKRDLQKFREDPNNALPEDTANLSAYEKLRINALSQCSYSTYSKDDNRPDCGLSLPDDKKLEKTIYSDTFKHKWKQPSKVDETTIKDSSKIETESIGGSIGDNDFPDGEIDDDDDDMMLNEDYDDDNDEGVNKVDQEAEKMELDRLKNQLLKMPKMKLSLKVTPLNYEDDEDED